MRRGCNFWLRLVGSYPNGRNYPHGQNYYNLKRNGKKVGEFRCGPGAQTVIFGEHPDSTPENPMRYSSIASKSVIEIKFSDIPWPKDFELSWIQKRVFTQINGHANRYPIGASFNKRITAYVAQVPSAISGQDGHGQTFSLARSLINGWALSIDEPAPAWILNLSTKRMLITHHFFL